MSLVLFVKLKYGSSTIVLFVGIRYSMRDLLSDLSNYVWPANGGAEIARLDNAAPDTTDRNGLNICRPKKSMTSISELNPVCHDSTATLTMFEDTTSYHFIFFSKNTHVFLRIFFIREKYVDYSMPF